MLWRHPFVRPRRTTRSSACCAEGKFRQLKVPSSKGWSSVLHSTGIYSSSRDFAGMPIHSHVAGEGFDGAKVGGDDGGRFRWGSAPSGSGSGEKGEVASSAGTEIQVRVELFELLTEVSS